MRQKPTNKSLRLQKNNVGRRRDPSLDALIMKASLEILAEAGYNGMTVDSVAERAKIGKAALYRRWKSKEDLVIDSISYMKRSQVDLEKLPDTGTLRGDLLALVKPQTNEEREFRMKVMSGLSSMITQRQKLASAGTAAIVEPWANVYSKLIIRSLERGEIKTSVDIKVISQIVPSMIAFQTIVLRKPFDKKFLVSLIDGVVLPALGIIKYDVKEKIKGSQNDRSNKSR